MIKALSFAAVLALSASAPAYAQEMDAPSTDDVCSAEATDFSELEEDLVEDADMSPAIRELQDAAKAFGERMKGFETGAKTICADTALSDEAKEMRIAALWTQYEPEISAFSMVAARLGPQIAAEALSQIDVAALTSEAMAEANESGAIQGAMGVARNSAWTSGDPEHEETLGLVASYALGEAMDEADADADEAAADEARAAEAAPAAPPAKPATPNHAH
jgi:hypothetical protein